MTTNDLLVIIGILTVLVAAAGVFIGIPAWRMQQHAVRTQRASDRQTEFNRRLLVALTGSEEPDWPSPDHPSVTDALKDIRDSMTELAVTQSVVAHHISDGHGGMIPLSLRSRL